MNLELPAAIRAVQKSIRRDADTKGLAFRAEWPDGLPNFVRGDERRLRKVLLNLLCNAIKYTQRGEVRLTIRPQSNQKICFEVTDTGPGIAEEQKERIFEAFYQINGDATKGEGTGLGLSLSQKFVCLMGGEPSLESSLGHSSAFRFALPLPRTDNLTRVNVTRIVGLAKGQASPRILADHNPDYQWVVKQSLERIGCVVSIVCNGLEETPNVSLSPEQEETVVTLSALPAEVHHELADAAEILDLEAAQAIAERLRADYPNETKFIINSLENFRFDVLLKLCERK